MKSNIYMRRKGAQQGPGREIGAVHRYIDRLFGKGNDGYRHPHLTRRALYPLILSYGCGNNGAVF